VPASPDTTVHHIDIWAAPVSGLPVQAAVPARGGRRRLFVTRFLELHLSAPAAAVLTPPAVRAEIGYTETEAPDILSAVNRRRFGQLPARLGELSRRDAVAGVSAAGVYGAGLTQLIVISLPGRFGRQAYDQLSTYGSAVTVARGDAALLGTGLLSVLVVRGQRTYLVAGLVQPAVLQRVAGDLAEAAG